MEKTRPKTINRAPTITPAASGKAAEFPRGTPSGPIQYQHLNTVSTPHDPAEQEADGTARTVMRMSMPEESTRFIRTTTGGMFRQITEKEREEPVSRNWPSPSISRFADCGILTKIKKDTQEDAIRRTSEEPEEEELIQPKDGTQEEEKKDLIRQKWHDQKRKDKPIHRKAEGMPHVAPHVMADIQSSWSTGTPLPLSIRRFMEPRFQADFSRVIIHTGEKAAELNRQLGAQAFTVRGHVFFGNNRFRPDHHEGKELIAHELTHTIQQGAAIQHRVAVKSRASEAGILRNEGSKEKRLYHTLDGKLVELPPGMTEAEAAKLEADGKAAEKMLGKGLPPKPVPQVKNLSPKEKKDAKKEEKQPKPHPRIKGKRITKKKEAVTRKPGAAVTALLKAVGPGKVAQYLALHGAPALIKGIGSLDRLKRHEETHDTAAEKRRQSEQAVIIPPSDRQSKSNAAQVTTIQSLPAPSVNDKNAKQMFQKTLAENIPRTIEDVDNFKRDKIAQHMGSDVLTVIHGDSRSVIETYVGIEHTPPPAPPEHIHKDLPPIEPAPPTPPLNLGKGVIAPLQKEHVDVSNYLNEADRKLQEEGVTQEQLDMVDRGDLAEANKEKKGMERTAKTEPPAVQEFAHQEAIQVDKSLKQEEHHERTKLKVKRTVDLGATARKQKETKTALEKKREEVASTINGIYQEAQKKVKKKLADLETQSLKRFDEGNAQAATTFQDNVKRQLDVYKADRYSGWFGWARKAKDWLLGMDQLPRVKAIFENNRAVFVRTINQLVERITADNQRVIQECKDELDNAKMAIQTYVDRLGPGLEGIGKKTAGEIQTKLHELDHFIDQKEQALQDKLKDKQQGAIKAIDEKIEKMKEAMSGALAKLGRLLLYAAKKFFSWALEKFGFSLSTIESIIDKGTAVLKAIFIHPIQFVKNLVRAAGTGFRNFGKNFLTHLKDALFEWLTGSLEGLVLPKTWDVKGIVSVVFQLLGITYQNIRSHLLKLIPEPVVKSLESTFTLVKTLITEGPLAAWEQLKDMVGEMKDAFIEAVKDWIKWKVVQKAIETILGLFIPGAGIIRAIIGIYDTIVFFIQKAKAILEMVGNFLGSIAEIAAGNISAAAGALENGLARGLKLVLDFLARFLRLTGITKKIRDVIQKIRDKVDKVLDRLVEWIVAQARKVGKALVKGATRAGQAIGLIPYPEKSFQAGDESHRLYIDARGGRKTLLIASEPSPIELFLDRAQQSPNIPDERKTLIPKARQLAREINQVVKAVEAETDLTEDQRRERLRPLLSKEIELASLIQAMLRKVPLRAFNEKYRLEGLVGTYGTMPRQVKDRITPDHQPQASVLAYAAGLPIFAGRRLRQIVGGGHVDGGMAINLHHYRHVKGRTYGRGPNRAGVDSAVSAHPSNPPRQRTAVIGVLRSELRADVATIKDVVQQKNNKVVWKDIFEISNLNRTQKTDLINTISHQIISGENRIDAQDLDSLKNPT